MSQAEPAEAETDTEGQNGDMHLRIVQAVLGYHIKATDGDIGRVQVLLVDEATWAIRHMVVNTSHRWLERQVLVASQWVQQYMGPKREYG